MMRFSCSVVSFLALCGIAWAGAVRAETDSAPADAPTADMTKPVKVFILLGQSNMVGAGKVTGEGEGSLTYAVRDKGKYPYLLDEQGNWAVRRDVRYVRVMGSGTGPMRLFNNEWLTVGGGKIGPELGIGHALGDALDEPVLILKSCIGNRSLGWDLLPPGSERCEVELKDPKTGEVKTWVYAGYKDSPARWEKGTTPEPIAWYAGMQYDGDTANAKAVLAELDKYYPGATGYEIAGFFWWQGDKDRYDPVHAARYEQNLVRLIDRLRTDFNAPDAKFVCATLGQTEKGSGGNDGLILDAQLAVDGESGKYTRFRGNVATVYGHPLCHGGASNSHYGGHAETYMDVGEAMGRAMVRLLRETPSPKP
ncbi:sialate O-acetylesterase [Thermopirellula anaerolimosa]